jgi:hypothetical protein
MPADIDTFIMLRENVIALLDLEGLNRELERVDKMVIAVIQYQNLVLAARRELK